ncbi:DUF2283 domain-containing protein [Methanobrevibacter curvatus]|uniref:DUF2283 domain-containing protein n=1 Tax=Methanobrevibacter curvatus TaxID=49547 RepID=A0A166E349_9EURY|nr:DUF2283 domain-containing protein [Methanobrevibacter curvatus]KZX16228.1 hypothetical protein MBCUR_01080 [Methanobrevibacter curvatus]
MKENILFFNYDLETDILFFYNEKNKYEFSEFLTNKIVLDLNKNNEAIGLEITDASNLFKVKKELLTKIKVGYMEIAIDEENIKLEVLLILKTNKESLLKPINIRSNNELHIPNLETEVAITSI